MSSACSALSASVTRQPKRIEKPADDGAHFGIVLDEQHLETGRDAPAAATDCPPSAATASMRRQIQRHGRAGAGRAVDA